MSTLKRAFLYTMRKKTKTLILFLVLVTISTFILTGLSIYKAADDSALSLRQSVGGSIRLELDENNRKNWQYQQAAGGMLVDYIGAPITDEDIQKIMSIDGIKAYNGLGDGSVFAKNFSFISGFSFGAGSDYSRLPSVTDSEYFNFFTRKAFQLVEGRHIKKDDDHVVLISTAIAEKNALKLGDTITVQCCYDSGNYPDVTLTIIGIYAYEADNEFNTTSTDKRNRLIIDNKAMQEIMQRDVIQYDNGVDFYVDDPREMERIASQIKALDLDWDSFTLTMDNSAYEAVASPLTAMQNLIVWLIVGCVAVSVGILILILSMWIKQRRHETGILLSVGISKSRILLQYTVEVLMIAVVAFGLSFFTSSLISQGVSDLIFHQVSESQPLLEIELPDDGTEYLDITGQYIPYDTSNVETLESVQVDVSPDYLLYIYIFGTLLIVFSVSAASISVIQMKPKKILSQMS
ncbi:ABC transporter permease [bacterium D16-51]|nr:ABC transporter permease [bacterium D16-59]RKI55936.1 ABC transporter permease [bacterium D16-51]